MKNELILAYALENAIEHEGQANQGAVIGHLCSAGLNKQDIPKTIPIVKEIVDKINSLKPEEQIAQFEQLKKLVKKSTKKQSGLPHLINVKRNPVFRLAPYPSGDLHIGNARTYLLNAIYAEKYNGKIKLVIDDTIGSEEKQIIKEAYNLIPETFNLLRVKFSKPIIYKSDRLKKYYKHAEELIRKGHAYVCHCSAEKFRKLKEEMRECACRQFPAREQMKRWKSMFKKSTAVGAAVLRLKTDMQHPNPAFRDRVLFRISERRHPRVGKKYRVWPMLEFSWAIDDHLLGITHIIRGKDLMMETEVEKFIWNLFKWKHPEVIHSGMMRMRGLEGAKISKSKSQKEVLSGTFIGWDDPRTWSIHSLIRRGITEEALREFVRDIGLTENDIVVPIDALYSINRKKIDKRANRYFFITDPVEIKIKNKPPAVKVKLKLNPSRSATREIIASKIFISREDYENFKDKEIRLIHLYNLLLSDPPEYTGMQNKKIQKIQWVSKPLKTRIMMPNGTWVEGFADDGVKKLKKHQIIQFERFGFCRFDQVKKGYYEFWFAHS